MKTLFDIGLVSAILGLLGSAYFQFDLKTTMGTITFFMLIFGIIFICIAVINKKR